jgi:hypothetical protein
MHHLSNAQWKLRGQSSSYLIVLWHDQAASDLARHVPLLSALGQLDHWVASRRLTLQEIAEVLEDLPSERLSLARKARPTEYLRECIASAFRTGKLVALKSDGSPANTPEATEHPLEHSLLDRFPPSPDDASLSSQPGDMDDSAKETIQTGNTAWKDSQTGKEYASRDGVPVFNQGDGDWKNLKLKGTGTGDSADRRIGNKGCAMSACAMSVSALSGETITPAEMDRHLDANGGYDGNSNVVWSKTTTAVKTPPPSPLSVSSGRRPKISTRSWARASPWSSAWTAPGTAGRTTG